MIKFATDITEQKKQRDEVNRLKGAVDQVQATLILIDRDFRITYSTKQFFVDNVAAFKEVFPGFDPESLIGTCIDVFHKDPAHQRRLLYDPGICPYEADLQVGPLTLSIIVNALVALVALVDDDGTFVGNSLEWLYVTEDRRKASEVARLQTAVDNAQTAHQRRLLEDTSIFPYETEIVVGLDHGHQGNGARRSHPQDGR